MFYILSALLSTHLLYAASPLAPLKLDTPRDTMRSFISAMDDYQRGLKSKDKGLESRIDDAAQTLNLDEVPFISRQIHGRKTAIFLKEVIDRIIVIDYEKVPDDKNYGLWRLKDTNIKINKVAEGESAGEYKFTPQTVERAEEFFEKVRHLPYIKGSGQGAGYKAPWTKSKLPEWAQGELLGLQRWQWLGLLLAIFAGYLIKLLTELLLHVAQKIVSRKKDSTRRRIVVALEKPAGLVLASGFWLLAIYFLKFEGLALSFLLIIVQITFSISIVWAAYRLSDVITSKLAELAAKTESQLDDQLVPLASKSLRIFVVVVGVLLTIQNLGFNVMSVLAGLGLGGLAFALAAKDTAANLFGSIMILTDRPFTIGDWIVTPDAEGTVVEIGFRSTRLKTFYDSVVSIPNSSIASTNIDNMGQRRYRRVKTTLGVTYDTPPEKVEAFVRGIKEIIAQHPHTRKDYYHVVFNNYADFSLNVLVYFFFEVPDWATELIERENIFLEIYKLADKLGVQFAFPTQTLHVDSLPKEMPGRLEPAGDLPS